MRHSAKRLIEFPEFQGLVNAAKNFVLTCEASVDGYTDREEVEDDLDTLQRSIWAYREWHDGSRMCGWCAQSYERHPDFMWLIGCCSFECAIALSASHGVVRCSACFTSIGSIT
jgi:hypothetical protein